MNELFILSELMEEPQNGYQLRHAMQVSLGVHRKISFGVIYPLLNKLAGSGLINLKEQSGTHASKIAMITDKGRKRFLELMTAPIADNAHTEDLYLIKLDAMQHLSISAQKRLLNDFEQEQIWIMDVTQDQLAHLNMKSSIDHWYAEQKLQLRFDQAQLALHWAQNFEKKLTE